MADISYIIVNWNTRELLLSCLGSVFDHTKDVSFEVYVVDNGSADGSAEAVTARFGNRVHLIENRDNLGFARANNQAIARASGNYIVLLNSDAELKHNTIPILIGFLDTHPDAAMAGPKMLGDNHRVQNSFDNFPCLLTELVNKSLLRIVFPSKFSGKPLKRTQAFEVDSLIGACVAVRRKAVTDTGAFDEDYFFFMEETDWCLRLRKKGWRIYHVPEATVLHRQGQSKRQDPAAAWIEYYRSLYIFFKKHRSRAACFLLRGVRFLKLIINLGLNILACVLTLGQNRRYREKTYIYFRLALWHIRCCPDAEGLKKPC